MLQEEELTLESTDLPLIFRENECRRFANLQCQDIDLLHISRLITHGGSSLAAVGVCLHVDKKVVAAIEKDALCSKQQDKIHKILTEWQWHNTHNSTWATLTSCLLALGDPKLMDDIQAYLSQKEYPRNDTHLSREQVSVQETSSVAADSPLISPASVSSTGSSSLHRFMNNSESDNVPGSPTSAIAVPSSDKFSSLSSTSQSALVSGISPASGASAATPSIFAEQVNPAVRNSLALMEESFADLLVTASTELETLKAPVDKVCLYLTSLSASTQANAPCFDKYTAALMNESSISGIFNMLSRTGDFSFLNFRLLQLVVKKFGNQDLEAQVEKYGVKVNGFMKETKLTDFLRVWSGQVAHGSVPSRQLLIVKLDREWPKATLLCIARMEEYLAAQFLLHDFIFRFSEARPGCVSLVWLIPASAAHLIKDAMKAKTPNFKKMKIRELIVNGDVLFQARVPLSLQSYPALYKKSITQPDVLWGELAHRYLRWRKPFKQVMQCNMAEGDIKWFLEGKLNVSDNCLDRHVEEDPSRVALIWEKDEPNEHVQVTYRELLEMTCRIANVLRRLGVSKHQAVIICMPVFPLAVASMLACARIGAVHSVVFSTFHAMDLKKRILDAKAKVVITANERMAGGCCLPLKTEVDMAVEGTEVEVVLVAHRTPTKATMTPGRDLSLEKEMATAENTCSVEEMDSEDPLFIIYTSGVIGEPKGIVHSQAGYLLYAAVTHEYVFDYHPGEDVFACVADLGWITGHTYVVYGPLCNGGTTVLFESTATYPNPGRYWEMVERLKVNQFFTAPSAIRHLMKVGDEHVSNYNLSSLRTVASTGEPLDVKAWNWYHDRVGQGRCRVVDAWWQTETGGIAITPPSQCEVKPGFIMKPFLGVEPVLMDENGEEIHRNDADGVLCLKKPLPGMGRKLTGEKSQERFRATYFQRYPGYYFTSDVAHRDAAGDYMIIARKDDVIKKQGVWLSVTEIESVMNMSDPRVKETCLIGYRHENRGSVVDEAEQHTCAFLEVQGEVGKAESREVCDSVKRALQREIGDESARPEKFIVMKNPPQKTYSGKIVRHILRNVATEFETLKPGEEDPKETPYRDELKQIAEDMGICGCYA